MRISTFVKIISLIIAIIPTAAAGQFKVSQAGLQKVAKTRARVVISPLPATERLARIKAILKVNAQAKTLSGSSLVDSVTLSVSSAAVDGNLLKFNNSSQVSPAENYASFDNLPDTSQVGVFLIFKAPVNGTYVFDLAALPFEASPNSPKTFTLANVFGPTRLKQQVTSTQDKHVIFVVQNVNAGANWYFVNEDNGSWEFYSVTISQLKF